VKPRRRYYERASVTGEGPFGIALDGRPLKTRYKHPLLLASRPLAEAIAAEWQGQGALVRPSRMPFTELACRAIDHLRSGPTRARAVKNLVEYAGSDLVCYRAPEPASLVARQREQWNPVLEAIRDMFGVDFVTVEGLIHRQQPAASLMAVAQYLNAKSDLELSAIHGAATHIGSTLIALVLAEGRMTAEAAWKAANVDEDWQIELWGEDTEAKARRERMEREFLSAAEFLRLAADKKSRHGRVYSGRK
jgi:chaperone required for assembly of F1-ATPase